MTEEQYKRIIDIHNEIENLQYIMDKLENPNFDIRLIFESICKTGTLTWHRIQCSDIKDILKKHELLIREEIRNKIENLHKEIEDL